MLKENNEKLNRLKNIMAGMLIKITEKYTNLKSELVVWNWNLKTALWIKEKVL